MCRAIDVANTLINLSIERVEETNDERYYVDFYKINKLLYIAQIRTIEQYKKLLFTEDIYARASGPCINELEPLFYKYRTEPIKEKVTDPVSIGQLREEILSEIIIDYGRFTRQDLGDATKATKPYHTVYEEKANSLIPKVNLKFSDDDLRIINQM